MQALSLYPTNSRQMMHSQHAALHACPSVCVYVCGGGNGGGVSEGGEDECVHTHGFVFVG